MSIVMSMHVRKRVKGFCVRLLADENIESTICDLHPNVHQLLSRCPNQKKFNVVSLCGTTFAVLDEISPIQFGFIWPFGVIMRVSFNFSLVL